jgi:hypothetical protein
LSLLSAVRCEQDQPLGPNGAANGKEKDEKHVKASEQRTSPVEMVYLIS